MRLYDGGGRPVALGREIARGGEGAVVEVTHDPSLVAKVYHTAVDKEKIAKLATMARLVVPELQRVAAWPTSTLHEVPGGEVVGILMPKVSGHREIHQLYSPAQRKLHFPKADWGFLVHVAMNCAAAFETIHNYGHVIGDVNQSGVLASDHGTVRLIDCDSFQVRSNGKLFRCVVGVPQYTPPELQGRAFRDIERTREHDAFGLALLVFHLLFMGRHPFAGRFHGTGDMPIERAISEGRFAFGPLAQTRQMTPPPFALPLTVLPNTIANMFERAFSRQILHATRPPPAEWREGLLSLRNNLKTCGGDHGHRYPGNLPSCPWCDIMAAGGPNFFISVQLVISGAKVELPNFDFEMLWRRIDSIDPPSAQRPFYPPPVTSPVPRPFSAAIREQRLLFLLVRSVTVLAVVLAAIGTVANALVSYVGFGLAITFGVWWAVLTSTSKLKRELRRRRGEAKNLRIALENDQNRWDHLTNERIARFRRLKAELRPVAAQAIQLRLQFEQDRRYVDSQRRDEQMNEFLDTKFIRDGEIEKIGTGRRATMLSYGIETAADVTRKKLEDIPGFGPKIIQRMLDWRAQAERDFRFDATRPASLDRMRALVMKYGQMQQRCEATLTAGAKELRDICDSSAMELQQTSERIGRLVVQVRQADADLKAR